MRGIIGYGTYIPRYRLQRAAISEALRIPAQPGTRSVASFDEDTTSLGVEAGRAALRATRDFEPERLLFATPAPAYLDKTNATVIHAALGLPDHVAAYDMVGSSRSGVGALTCVLDGRAPAMAVMSDIRTGLPGGPDESGCGDAAAAFLIGDDPGVIAEVLATASASLEFTDRWRIPGEPVSRVWEERFGETTQMPLGQSAVVDVLKVAGLTLDEVDYVVVTSLATRTAARVVAGLGLPATAICPDYTKAIGNTGAAHFGLMLADALDRSRPGELILAVSLADGYDALLLRTTEAVASYEPETTVSVQVASTDHEVSYPTFLTWREILPRETTRRPEPDRPAPPPSLRSGGWKFGFVSSRCDECQARHLPPQRTCFKCGAVDQMSPEGLADVPGTITALTVDNLAYSLNPPTVVAVIDFDGGGRYQCEVTDIGDRQPAIGDRVVMTFRRLYTAGGIHNYFWKARPAVTSTKEA